MKNVLLLVVLCQIWLCDAQNARIGLCDQEMCKCWGEGEDLFVDCSETNDDVAKVILLPNHFVDDKNATIPMKALNLSNVIIHSLTFEFPKSSLKILDLSNNKIFNISDGVFKNLQDMDELILSHNSLTIVLPEVFKGLRLDGQDYPLRSLHTLRLDHNHFHTLNSDIFQHIDRDVENLYLNDNPFKIIDLSTLQAINSLTFLKSLDLSNTQISVLPEHFMHTPAHLLSLDLSRNNISSVSTLGLEESRVLEVLYLNGNPIVNLTNETGFPTVKTLKVVHMCEMPVLEAVGAHSLSNLPALEDLYLSDNPKLATLHQEALIRKDGASSPIVQSLKKFYIRNNRLTHLDLEMDWSRLIDLDIRDNPWLCECDNEWMLITLMPIYEKINSEQANELKCAAPVPMEGRFFSELYDESYNMRCLDLNGARPERDGTILVCMLLGLLLGVVLVFFCMYSYQRHWFGVFDKSPAAFSRQFYGRTKTQDDNDLY